MRYEDILLFWFEELTKKQWFEKSDTVDSMIRERFLSTYEMSVSGELHSWRSEPHGYLAEIIVLDQFSRNIFRDSPQAFLYDPLALCLSQHAVHMGYDKKIDISQRGFLYMPYMHSESITIHEEAVRLFQQPGLESNYKFELAHKKIIDQFGRYPHRNSILGRDSTPEEVQFLTTPNSSF